MLYTIHFHKITLQRTNNQIKSNKTLLVPGHLKIYVNYDFLHFSRVFISE